MRRIQIHLEEDVDDRLAIEARERGMPKAALIRLFIRQGTLAAGADPIDAVVGLGDGAPVEHIDEVLYGR